MSDVGPRGAGVVQRRRRGSGRRARHRQIGPRRRAAGEHGVHAVRRGRDDLRGARQNVAGGGRDHWSRAYSALFVGAGFARGRVVGRTDRIGGDVADAPFSPKDVVATLFHVLGVDPQAEIHARLGRPYAIGGTGRVRTELLA